MGSSSQIDGKCPGEVGNTGVDNRGNGDTRDTRGVIA